MRGGDYEGAEICGKASLSIRRFRVSAARGGGPATSGGTSAGRDAGLPANAARCTGEAFLALLTNEVHRGCAAVAQAKNIAAFS